MENASKALLIAGAILIVILLIGVGMMVYQGAQSSIDEGISQMTANQRNMFNSTFTKYQGTKVSGSNVRALIQDIMNSNTTNKDVNGKLVSVTGDKSISVTSTNLQSSSLSSLMVSINTGAFYTVTPTIDDTTGLVKSISIKKNN